MEVSAVGLLPEALLVDLPEVDCQHEEIFSRIETLKIACFDGGFVPADEFHALLEFFKYHFATEERIAEEAGLEFAEHAKIHRDALRLLHKALSEVFNGVQDVHSFLRFSEYWFERHINEEDRQFVATLQSGSHTLARRLPAAGTLLYSAHA